MMYYLLLDDDTEKDAIYDTNVLGEESFGVFYPSVGFTAFNNIIRKHPDLVDNVKIYDDTKKSYTISEFISVLEEFKIKSAWLLIKFVVSYGSRRVICQL